MSEKEFVPLLLNENEQAEIDSAVRRRQVGCYIVAGIFGVTGTIGLLDSELAGVKGAVRSFDPEASAVVSDSSPEAPDILYGSVGFIVAGLGLVGVAEATESRVAEHLALKRLKSVSPSDITLMEETL